MYIIRRQLYAQGNALARRFHMCSDNVKVTLVEYLLRNPAGSLGWFSSSFFSCLVVMIFVKGLYILDSKQIGL